MNIVRISSSAPVTHVSSRGYLYAPKKNTRPMCRKTTTIIALAPHLCMPRTSQPHVTSLVIASIDWYAELGSGA